MTLKNYSSRIRTKGSDYDVVLWCNPLVWALIEMIVKDIRNRQVYAPVNFLNVTIDLFLAPIELPGIFTMAAVISHTIQHTWTQEIVESYRNAKSQIAHLNGKERKAAKIELAKQFSLPTVQYTWVPA